MNYLYLGLIFLVSITVLYKISYNHFREKTSDKKWKGQWGMKTSYWEGVVILGFGITMIIYSLFQLVG